MALRDWKKIKGKLEWFKKDGSKSIWILKAGWDMSGRRTYNADVYDYKEREIVDSSPIMTKSKVITWVKNYMRRH